MTMLEHDASLFKCDMICQGFETKIFEDAS